MWAVMLLMKFPVQRSGLLDATCADTRLIRLTQDLHASRELGGGETMPVWILTRPDLDTSSEMLQLKKEKGLSYFIGYMKIPKTICFMQLLILI